MTFDRGVRPARGKNLAIAEWPTFTPNPHPGARKDGRADYVLFAGLQVVGVVEAKRAGKDVSSVIHQAQDYSAGYLIKGNETLPEGSPWGVHKVPFLFSTNGRAYLRQLKTKSGIWFHDVRRPQNLAKPLEGWHTPEGLLALLKQNEDEAYAKLKVEPMPYIDRDYQRAAILSVEQAIEAGKRELLVQEKLGLRLLSHHKVGRHSVASQAVTSGESVKAVQAQLGHRSEQSTHKYAHLGSGAQKRLIETLTPKAAPHEAARRAQVNLGSTSEAEAPTSDLHVNLRSTALVANTNAAKPQK